MNTRKKPTWFDCVLAAASLAGLFIECVAGLSAAIASWPIWVGFWNHTDVSPVIWWAFFFAWYATAVGRLVARRCHKWQERRGVL